MGLFFSNLHIRKNDQFDLSQLKSSLVTSMTDQGYRTVENAEDAEVSVQIYCDDHAEWVSVVSDCFEFHTPESSRSAAAPLSSLFQTDVLAAACVDSDYLMLNLINETDGTDAWINVGRPYGKVPRRTGLRAWKDKVTDYEKFQSVMRADYTFAEEALYEAEDLLGLSAAQSTLMADCDDPAMGDGLTTLLFAFPQDMEREAPRLELHMPTLMPCVNDQDRCVFVVNKGGRSRGIAVTFQGDYVEKDEITFECVQLEYDISQGPDRRVIPIKLEKKEAADGSYFWYWEDENFQIPPKVNQDLPMSKYMNMEHKRVFGVRFTPHGDPRKMLDIQVFIIPLENYRKKAGGAACWYAWRLSPSKEAYIERFNQSWKGFDDDQILDPADFEL